MAEKREVIGGKGKGENGRKGREGVGGDARANSQFTPTLI